MDSLSFRAGRAFLSSDSPAPPWTAVFEDEGPAGYFYACDRSHETQEDSILDAMLIYTGSALQDRTRDRLASIQWSRDGAQCVLYLDGSAQALIDFTERISFCRSNFPNFLDDSQTQRSGRWRRSSHLWDDASLQRFESALYAA